MYIQEISAGIRRSKKHHPTGFYTTLGGWIVSCAALSKVASCFSFTSPVLKEFQEQSQHRHKAVKRSISVDLENMQSSGRCDLSLLSHFYANRVASVPFAPVNTPIAITHVYMQR